MIVEKSHDKYFSKRALMHRQARSVLIGIPYRSVISLDYEIFHYYSYKFGFQLSLHDFSLGNSRNATGRAKLFKILP